MEDKRAISSVRSALFVVAPVTLDTTPLGYVENFTASKRHMAENIRSIGQPVPPDNVLNFEEGSLNWGRFLTRDPVLTAIITPRIAEFADYSSYDILAMDPDDGKALALAVGVLPQSFDVILRGGAAARNNYSAICRMILLDEEIQQSINV